MSLPVPSGTMNWDTVREYMLWLGLCVDAQIELQCLCIADASYSDGI